jgi:hypothetical protein
MTPAGFRRGARNPRCSANRTRSATISLQLFNAHDSAIYEIFMRARYLRLSECGFDGARLLLTYYAA